MMHHAHVGGSVCIYEGPFTIKGPVPTIGPVQYLILSILSLDVHLVIDTARSISPGQANREERVTDR